MKSFAFFWSPEGRRLATYKAKDITEARRMFRQAFPRHAKFMGEVYVEIN